MEAEGDPEARIRELERPLAESARTSELGGASPGGYDLQSRAPAMTGAPFSPPPFTTSAGFRPWWIVVAVVVVGAVVFGGSVAFFFTRMPSEHGSVNGSPGRVPGVSGSSQANHPGTRPDTSDSASPVPTAPESPSLPPAGGELSVAGVGVDRTIACNDSLVTVSGFSNTVVITGHCASLTVSGGQNVVTVDTAEAIEASGFDNRVTYHSGSPGIDKSGEGNVVEMG